MAGFSRILARELARRLLGGSPVLDGVSTRPFNEVLIYYDFIRILIRLYEFLDFKVFKGFLGGPGIS